MMEKYSYLFTSVEIVINPTFFFSLFCIIADGATMEQFNQYQYQSGDEKSVFQVETDESERER